ncbi:hypothetical protein [Mycobacterium leprae]|uniref:hypothetical protein n=1 Tax=Mycobacterium leprae TaxID=1769 RepID=UPI0002EC17FA|nr:hypothetical protein [Mycobacterium leprae]
MSGNPDASPVLFVAGYDITSWNACLAQARDRAKCLEAMFDLATLIGCRETGAQV